MADCRGGCGADRRGQCCRKDEPRRVGADRIDERRASGDVATEAAKGLGERAFDHVDAVHGAVAGGDTSSTRAVHPDRMDLVEVGQGVVSLGEIADKADRGDVASHRIQALESDNLRPPGSGRPQQFLQMIDIVVTPDLLLGPRLPDALDHRVVVHRVRQDQAVRDQPRNGRDAGLVRNIAGGEDQGRRLAVQICQFALEFDQGMVGARDVPGAASTRAHCGRGLDHSADHLRVLTHAEVVVGAPDDNIPRAAGRMPNRMRKTAGDAFNVSKHAIAPLLS